MPRSVRSARSNSICSNISDGERNARVELLASRVKMGKKVEKSLTKDKNPSAINQDEVDSNKALDINKPKNTEPYVCTGNFGADFTELCRRGNMSYTPPVLPRPKPPAPVTQQEASPVKGAGKDKGKVSATQPEPETEENHDDGESADALPKTFALKDKFEYFKPCIQVEMEEKHEIVTEIFIRGWKIDVPMMDILTQCWQSTDKLHSINLWNTGLNSETLHMLANIIPNCPNIKNVTLDGNTVEDENWFELIVEESPIQNLSLRHCGITDKGAIMIGRCLGSAKRGNKTLLSLNLSNNKIGDEGVKEIAQGLRLNRTLLSLSLASNHVGDQGVIKLSEVLSKFPLTHEEVVERRRQQSDRASPDRNKSPPLSRRADSKDRPGSVRSNTHADKKKMPNISAKGKKDPKGGKEEKEEKHDKAAAKGGKKEKEEKPAAKKDGKGRETLKVPPGHGHRPNSPKHESSSIFGPKTGEPHISWIGMMQVASLLTGTGSTVGGRNSGASLAPDAKGKKGGKPVKGQGKATAQELETSDSPEFINPLLEGGDVIDGQLWVAGNRVLINLNLSRNNVGEHGLSALLTALKYQRSIVMDSHSSGTGLMRLLVGRSRHELNSLSKLRREHEQELVHTINDYMLPKDPFYKPPPATPDVTDS
ncbi:leucine-rich repeat-containing protein 71-like isoform X7 [Dreissena polymorpha]|uniref:leucine-rich repeat-containing protein 71-like isoform X7 n=1 Tax=Dreissena polymorpha TaxID=45954 RepID=UPI002263F8C7|nr:leucine-rich repeat-containing protein 71-like isoform X7 [Dreissena polymorpha]